ncbi:malate synthase A [Virgibacillus sp. W0430]|uniref:malate synthase A n=1 Tax=Virgibacillus sp. W0430 TaxID=3391580 RepID=UPI003F4462ED
MIKSTRVKVCNDMYPDFAEILSEEACSFLEKLHYKFNDRRESLLALRKRTQEQLNKGETLQFLPHTEQIRKENWTIDPLPEDLKDRRVEITGPVDRKMIINALNSGAKCYMACFEDASAPSWENMMNGQLNLRDAIRRTIDFTAANGKDYKLGQDTAVLIVRPRGWHLNEQNIQINEQAMSGSLVDFGLYFYHNAKALLNRGTGPYFYLPKLENHLEARLWNEVFIFAQDELGIPQGTIKATVLIETITAAFEMDEILYELKHHSAGLNCGRWDYIFSFIKKFQRDERVLFPDRSLVTMEVPFMRAYTQLAIQTCHRRNAPAIGGMAAQIPVKNDNKANEIAFQRVREDKERECKDGHDGTWVAHPGMVQLVKEIFDQGMPMPNQIDNKLDDVCVTAEDLLQVPSGEITESGLRTNIKVGIIYLASWLQGRGAVPINNLMEDAATAEISRAQIWQWIRHPEGKLTDGRNITFELVDQLTEEELKKIESEFGTDIFASSQFIEASTILNKLIKQTTFEEFLTIPAYDHLIKGENSK